MAKKNGSTAQSNRGLPSKDAEGFARLEYLDSLTSPEQETYLAKCDPVLRLALREWLVSKQTGIGEAGKIKVPPERPMRRELITLDFHEHGIEAKLLELLDMAKRGEINGLIFSARMTHQGGEPYLFGCEGRLLDNQAEAIGAAVLLQNNLAQA
jgi:hypothetical protein